MVWLVLVVLWWSVPAVLGRQEYELKDRCEDRCSSECWESTNDKKEHRWKCSLENAEVPSFPSSGSIRLVQVVVIVVVVLLAVLGVALAVFCIYRMRKEKDVQRKQTAAVEPPTPKAHGSPLEPKQSISIIIPDASSVSGSRYTASTPGRFRPPSKTPAAPDQKTQENSALSFPSLPPTTTSPSTFKASTHNMGASEDPKSKSEDQKSTEQKSGTKSVDQKSTEQKSGREKSLEPEEHKGGLASGRSSGPPSPTKSGAGSGPPSPSANKSGANSAGSDKSGITQLLEPAIELP